MKKIQIIILAAVGIASFGGAFGLTWFVKKSVPVVSKAAVGQMQGTAGLMGQAAKTGLPGTRAFGGGNELSRDMTEKHLRFPNHRQLA